MAPPNNIALELLIDVKVKSRIGGGLSPVTVGDIQSPKIINIFLLGEVHSHKTPVWLSVCTYVTPIYA